MADEIDSVIVASLPSLGDVLAHRHLDSFPVAWVALLHGWIAAGFGSTDEAVPTIGIMIGIATIPAIWWNGWRLTDSRTLVGLRPASRPAKLGGMDEPRLGAA